MPAASLLNILTKQFEIGGRPPRRSKEPRSPISPSSNPGPGRLCRPLAGRAQFRRADPQCRHQPHRQCQSTQRAVSRGPECQPSQSDFARRGAAPEECRKTQQARSDRDCAQAARARSCGDPHAPSFRSTPHRCEPGKRLTKTDFRFSPQRRFQTGFTKPCQLAALNPKWALDRQHSIFSSEKKAFLA
jgi:hypothetical protein